MLTFDRFREANVRRCRESFHRDIKEWMPAEWLVAATGELGEVAHVLKERRKGESVADQDIGDEIADTIAYLDLLAASLDIDLGAAVRRKFNAVSRRIGSDIIL